MSVATEFAPAVSLPAHFVPSGAAPRPVPGLRAVPAGLPASLPAPEPAPRLATVTALHAPAPRSVAAPVRLTRRGVVVLALAVAALCAGLVWLAWGSAPAATGDASTPATVTVRSGDTLWSIATRVAPGRDPRAEVADLQRLNGLEGVDLAAGQVLRTR